MKNSKKIIAMMLSTAFSLNVAAIASAAPTPEQLDALRAEIKELRQVLKVEKAKHKYEKAKDVERSKEWNVHGDIRAKYAKVDHDDVMANRFRVSIDHQVGDTMRFKGRWAVMNNNEYGLSTAYSKGLYRWNNTNAYNRDNIYPDFDGADNNWISDAYIEMDRVFGSTFTIGRFGHTFGATGFWSDAETSGGIDGVKASFDFREGKDNLTIGYANFGPTQDYPDFQSSAFNGKNNAYYADGTTAVPYYFSKGLGDALFLTGKKNIDKDFDLYAMYLRQFSNTNKNSSVMTSELTGTKYAVNEPWGDGKHKLWGLGFRKRFDPNIELYADYMQNRAFNGHQDATYLSLRYKKANMEQRGSFGLNLDYRRIGSPYTQAHYNASSKKWVNEYYSILAGNKLSSDMTLATDNTKGFVFGFQWVPGKNILIEGKQSFASKFTDTGEKAPDYSSLSVSTKF